MIDFNHLESYRESNRIEAKRAFGGLPLSIWETYSAFANTFGGVILLGVEERAGNALHTIGLQEPEKLVKEFWDTVNNRNKVSVNILSDNNVRIENVEGKSIIVINVPRAQRFDKPVYIGGNLLGGTYRRNGEGDYKCTKEEVQSMLRDAASQSQDSIVIERMPLNVFDYESIHKYRNRMSSLRPGHVWEELDDNDFLYKLGAVGRSADGTLHPTAAGLLMFGFEYEIVKEFSNYFLDYREELSENMRWTDRIVSDSGDWNGNLFDFYFRVYNKIIRDVEIPFCIENGSRIDATPAHTALREALANCLVNSDYYGRQGVVIEKNRKRITFSNPGNFRLDIEAAKSGGVSDPRNIVLIKMFNLIGIGERAGSGIPSIFSAWCKLGLPSPSIEERSDPERTILILPFEISIDETVNRGNETVNRGNETVNRGNETVNRENETVKQENETVNRENETVNRGNETVNDAAQQVLEEIKKVADIKITDLIKSTGFSRSKISRALSLLKEKGYIERVGSDKKGCWKILK